MRTKLTVLDLFSGAGGMSLGFHRNDSFKIVGAVDIERGKPSSGDRSTSCNETYQTNIGVTPFAADLSHEDPVAIMDRLEFSKHELGVLISCAPCTGFSQKNSRNQVVDDPRNQLVERSATFVEAYLPKYFVMENVKELIKGKHKHHFRQLHRKLTQLGYQIRAEVHDLCKFGVPQHRIRTLIIAKLNGAPPFPIQTHEEPRTVRDAIGSMSVLSAGETHADDAMHACPKLNAHSLERLRCIPKNGGSWIDIPDSHSHLRIPSMNVDDPGSYPDIYGRLAWDKPAPTITRECGHPGNGRYCHPEQDRLLSVREMSLIQGFPMDFDFKGSLGSRYRQIGDAVPPIVSAQIADVIRDDWLGVGSVRRYHMQDLFEAV